MSALPVPEPMLTFRPAPDSRPPATDGQTRQLYAVPRNQPPLPFDGWLPLHPGIAPHADGPFSGVAGLTAGARVAGDAADAGDAEVAEVAGLNGGARVNPDIADHELGRPRLDARQWSATLAVAVFETLHGRRPVGQLTRWVDERVQSAIAFHRRRSRSVDPGRPAVLRSIRVQYPREDVAEVCAHLSLAGRSYALALRLEAWGERWLCVAVEF